MSDATSRKVTERVSRDTVKGLLYVIVFGVISWFILTTLSEIVMTNGLGQGWRTVFALGGAWGTFMGIQLPSLASSIARDVNGSRGVRD